MQPRNSLIEKIADSLQPPLVVFSLDGKVTYIKPAFRDVFGWSLEELIGRTINWIPPELKAQTREDLERLLREKDSTIETKQLTKDGRVLDVVIRGQISSEDESDGFGAIFILRDVTEQRRMERTGLFPCQWAVNSLRMTPPVAS